MLLAVALLTGAGCGGSAQSGTGSGEITASEMTEKPGGSTPAARAEQGSENATVTADNNAVANGGDASNSMRRGAVARLPAPQVISTTRTTPVDDSGTTATPLISDSGTSSGSNGVPDGFDSDAAFLRIQSFATSKMPIYSAAGQAATFCQTGHYPAQWTWTSDAISSQPAPATTADGTPKIEQYRAGKLIATYDRLGGTGCFSAGGTVGNPDTSCGAFHRTPHRNWESGDVFLVYPAVYEGPEHHLWLGPMMDDYAGYLAGNYQVPANITIRGVTINGKRPVIKTGSHASYNTYNQALVYFETSENVVFENFDIDGSGGAPVGKAGIYVSGAKNLTIRDVRVYGMKDSKANGLFATDVNAGVLRIDRVELRDNGGDGGPEHNLYINKSDVDPQFTVWMTNSWSHSSFYGHLFKSRAQVNILEGNYFMGSRASNGGQTDAFLVDFPNGGRVFMRNNVLAKNYSGPNSNGVFVTYGMEGIWDGRPLAVRMEHNTFVSLARFFDDQYHELMPMHFFYPGKVPGAPDFPVSKVAIRNNVFAGFCPSGYAPANYRGDDAYVVGFEDLTQSFSVLTKRTALDSSVVGSRGYWHQMANRNRQAATIGARD